MKGRANADQGQIEGREPSAVQDEGIAAQIEQQLDRRRRRPLFSSHCQVKGRVAVHIGPVHPIAHFDLCNQPNVSEWSGVVGNTPRPYLTVGT